MSGYSYFSEYSYLDVSLRSALPNAESIASPSSSRLPIGAFRHIVMLDSLEHSLDVVEFRTVWRKVIQNYPNSSQSPTHPFNHFGTMDGVVVQHNHLQPAHSGECPRQARNAGIRSPETSIADPVLTVSLL